MGCSRRHPPAREISAPKTKDGGTRPAGVAARSRRSDSAFTLIEVMVAAGILVFGILSLMAAQLASLKFSRESRTRSQAMYLAERQIEQFHATSPASLQALIADPSYPDDPNNPLDPDPNDDDQMVFFRRWTIEPDTPESGVFTLTVEVDWADQLGNTRTTTLQSMKAEF